MAKAHLVSWEDAVPVDVLTEIVISQPAGTVAAYAADPANAPTWYKDISSITWETSPPLQTGSRVAFTARFLGRQLAYTYEITDFTPAEKLVCAQPKGPSRWKPPTPGRPWVTTQPG
jgi:hypothetical protein